MISIIFFCTLVAGKIDDESMDCSMAPKELRGICLEFKASDESSRLRLVNSSLRKPRFVPQTATANDTHGQPSSSLTDPSRTAYDCTDLSCLCHHFDGKVTSDGTCLLRDGSPLRRAYRKELRMLSGVELRRLNHAITQLKLSGEYDRLAQIHTQVASGSGAHSGPGFLPWHREFLKRFEIGLRTIDPSVSLPYWDSVIDSYLPDPKDSALWSPILLGESDKYGQVITGPYSSFHTTDGHPHITRYLGAEGGLFVENSIRNFMDQNSIVGVMAYTAPRKNCPYGPNFGALEYKHASIHLWVGGDMKPPTKSANDPVFYFHHSFVDQIFEQWRITKQTRVQRETEYSPNIRECTNQFHYSHASMVPFNLYNIQGLSNSYTDYLYTYAPRPTCSSVQPTCDSMYLFCSQQNGFHHCVSKIKLYGNCTGFEGEDVCIDGVCSYGVCRPESRTLIISERRIVEENEECFNSSPCCNFWVNEAICSTPRHHLRNICRRSCNICHHLADTECRDRSPMCRQWARFNRCRRNPKWMTENCPYSCKVCNFSKMQLCVELGSRNHRRPN